MLLSIDFNIAFHLHLGVQVLDAPFPLLVLQRRIPQGLERKREAGGKRMALMSLRK